MQTNNDEFLFDDHPPTLSEDEEEPVRTRRKKTIVPPEVPYTRSMMVGNVEPSKQIFNFVVKNGRLSESDGALINTLVVWGPHGVGKTAYTHLILRDLGTYVYTLGQVNEDGKTSVVEGIRRILGTTKGPVFLFLDHLVSVCHTKQDIKNVLSTLSTHRSRVSAILGIDNLHEAFLYPIKQAMTGKDRFIKVIQFYPLRDTHIRTILKRKDPTIHDTILRQLMEASHGDARAALRCLEWYRLMPGKGNFAASRRDVCLNPFAITSAAFEGQVETARTGELSILQRMAHANIDVLDSHVDFFQGGKKPETGNNGLASLAELSEALSDTALMRDDVAKEELILSMACTVGNNKWTIPNRHQYKWPSMSEYELMRARQSAAQLSHCFPSVDEKGIFRPTSIPMMDAGLACELVQRTNQRWVHEATRPADEDEVPEQVAERKEKYRNLVLHLNRFVEDSGIDAKFFVNRKKSFAFTSTR